jgi:large subunit ribosomal protein L30
MMKAIIRIRGKPGMNADEEERLMRSQLRRKYACIVVNADNKYELFLKKIRNSVAYGDIDDETLLQLIEKRAKPMVKTKKIDAKKIMEEFKKNIKSKDIKPFFSLHPPRGGIKSKIHYPKGILGDNGKEINSLVRRML